MIFFREREVRLRVQTSKGRFGFLLKIKAFYQGPIEPESGMIVNLVDVDRWILDVSSRAPVFQKRSEILKYYFTKLKKLSSLLVRVELTQGDRHFVFDGHNFVLIRYMKKWIENEQHWVRVSHRLRVSKSAADNI